LPARCASNLGEVLAMIRRQTTQVRGAIEGTMLRNEVFNFSRIGTFIERADNTARILDVKYYVLLPSLAWVGSHSITRSGKPCCARSQATGPIAGSTRARWTPSGIASS
jgi:uncharacterized alpha-E superfamily protein